MQKSVNNINVINDTLNKIEDNPLLRELTETAINDTVVIDEGFVSRNQPYYEDSQISFEENLTLLAAYRYADNNIKTAVLNFANPLEPGGGVLRGASAQEEYLCRASNLYPCLKSNQASRYYEYHKKIHQTNQYNSVFLGTDMLIYSPKITFFREDQNYFPDTNYPSLQVYSEYWRTIDVITCAAPFFNSTDYILPDGDLCHIFCRRIKNILEVAIENNIQALILGAFGCGAFHNPPVVVAEAFQTVFLEERYLHAFKNVVFAVKRSNWFCENIESFEKAFTIFPPTGEYVFCSESNKRRFFE